MKSLSLRGAAAIATVLTVAGCSGLASSPVTPGATAQAQSRRAPQSHLNLLVQQFIHRGVLSLPPHAANPAVKNGPDYPTDKPLLYISNQSGDSVTIYQISALKKNPSPIATISSGINTPYGLARNDADGDLYVGNTGDSEILIFKKGKTSSSGSISSGISEPLALSLSSTGELWVSNGGTGSVTIYPKGKTSPSKTISGFSVPFGSAFDKKGNFFVADFGASQVWEVKKGASSPTALNLTDLDEPLGCVIDKAGNLWVSDGGGDKVNVYSPGSTSPKESITGFEFPYQLSTDAAGAVFLTDVDADEVYEFAAGKYTPEATLTNSIDLPTGVLARP